MLFISVRGAAGSGRVRMVQTLMAELRVLIGKRAPPVGAPPLAAPPPSQHHYTRRDLKANLHRHMSIVLDRSVGLCLRFFITCEYNLITFFYCAISYSDKDALMFTLMRDGETCLGMFLCFRVSE